MPQHTAAHPAPELKTALITDSSRGLGMTLTDFLAAQGWALIVTARDAAALGDVAHTLER